MSETKAKKSKQLGNYELGKTLGVGAFGKVKMACHSLTGEMVAIKILEKEKIIDVTDVERVQRELHILKMIRHPSLIQLYEIIETPSHIFLVMEYCSKGEVFDYIVKQQRLKEEEASKFFQELISGIEYLHKLQVVHRDLKPENLLLDINNNIKVVDFGLSNMYKKNELLKTACGSPCYAAPEMIAGKKYESPQVDIWSSGVILFALICGFLPFEDEDTSKLYDKILKGKYSIPSHVSQDARDLLEKILNVDPEKRYRFDDIKQHKWFNLYKRPFTIPPGVIVGYNQMPIDQSIIKELEGHNIDADQLVRSLDANNHNNITTSYYLLLKKHFKSGGQSKADINSPIFDVTLIEPKKNIDQKYSHNYLNKLIRDVKNTSEKKKMSKESSGQLSGCGPEDERLTNTEKKGTGVAPLQGAHISNSYVSQVQGDNESQKTIKNSRRGRQHFYSNTSDNPLNHSTLNETYQSSQHHQNNSNIAHSNPKLNGSQAALNQSHHMSPNSKASKPSTTNYMQQQQQNQKQKSYSLHAQNAAAPGNPNINPYIDMNNSYQQQLLLQQPIYSTQQAVRKSAASGGRRIIGGGPETPSNSNNNGGTYYNPNSIRGQQQSADHKSRSLQPGQQQLQQQQQQQQMSNIGAYSKQYTPSGPGAGSTGKYNNSRGHSVGGHEVNWSNNFGDQSSGQLSSKHQYNYHPVSGFDSSDLQVQINGGGQKRWSGTGTVGAAAAAAPISVGSTNPGDRKRGANSIHHTGTGNSHNQQQSHIQNLNNSFSYMTPGTSGIDGKNFQGLENMINGQSQQPHQNALSHLLYGNSTANAAAAAATAAATVAQIQNSKKSGNNNSNFHSKNNSVSSRPSNLNSNSFNSSNVSQLAGNYPHSHSQTPSSYNGSGHSRSKHSSAITSDLSFEAVPSINKQMQGYSKKK